MLDHLRVLPSLKIELSSSSVAFESCSNSFPRPNWDKLTTVEIAELYTLPLEEALSAVRLRDQQEFITNPNLIDEDLLTLTNLMRDKALNNLPKKRFSPHVTPAWDDRLKRAQRKANDAYKKWRPRSDDSPLRILYKAAKGQFRAQLRLHISQGATGRVLCVPKPPLFRLS